MNEQDTTKISIIIPTLNEEKIIRNLLSHLQTHFPGTELIVADGGSADSTVAEIGEKARVVTEQRGRAAQMNAGAHAASGGIFWFLHADCMPTPRSIDLILKACSDERVVGGGFRWKLSGNKWYYGIVTGLAHVKNKLRRSLFGDMGIFVKSDIFNKLNGYADIPLMEEVEFNKRLQKAGKTVLLNEPLVSSDRRLIQRGPMKTFLINNFIKCAYGLGFSPESLKRFY